MNTTTFNVPQEVIDQLVEKEVEKVVKGYLTETTLTNLASIRMRKQMDMSATEEHIKRVMDNQFKDPHSYLNSSISDKLGKAIDTWIVNNKWTIESTIKQAITTLVKSNETYVRYVEPLVTKYIAEDASFIPYAKQEIHTKLNEKIKNFNKLVGDNISSQLVREFLQNYLSKRDLQNEEPTTDQDSK